MSKQSIIIIVAVFGVSFLAMIPILIFNQKKKGKVNDFLAQNSHQAVLHLYGEKCVVDGVKIKDMDFLRGNDLEYIVSLAPGKHEIISKYSASMPSMGKNTNYTTPKPIKSDIVLEAGHEYTLSMYFYSPEERKNYYNGDVGEDIYSQPLSITGSGLASYTTAYVICYLEK